MVFTPQKETRSRSPQPFGRFLSQLQDALKAEKQGSVQGRRFQGQSAVLPSCLSVALPLPDLDPLQALEQLGGFQVPHFYWEQPSAGLAIAAAHAAIQAKFQGPQRFSQAQAFVNQQQRRMVRVAIASCPVPSPAFSVASPSLIKSKRPAPFPPATLLLPRWQVVRQGQANRHLHHRLPKDQAESSFVANFQLRQGQVNPQEAREAWEVYCQLQALPRRDRLRAVQRSRSQAAAAVHSTADATANATGGSSSRLQCEFDGEAFEASVAAVLEAIDQGPGPGPGPGPDPGPEPLHKAVMAQVLKVQAESPLDPAAALVACDRAIPTATASPWATAPGLSSSVPAPNA